MTSLRPSSDTAFHLFFFYVFAIEKWFFLAAPPLITPPTPPPPPLPLPSAAAAAPAAQRAWFLSVDLINIKWRPCRYRPPLIAYKQYCSVPFPPRCSSPPRSKCLQGQASALAPSFGAPTPTARFHAINCTCAAADSMPGYDTYLLIPLSCASSTCATATRRRPPHCTVRHHFRRALALHASLTRSCHRFSSSRDGCHGILRRRPHRDCRHAALRLVLRRLRPVGGRLAPAALRSSVARAKRKVFSERRVCCLRVRPLRAAADDRRLPRVGL
jgi:hypothetical protein